jgi:hypothetical protein
MKFLSAVILPSPPALNSSPNAHNFMKPLVRAVPVFLCLAFGLSTPALSQKTYALGLGGGVAIPVGKLGDTQKSGYNALAVLAVGVADLPLGLRIDGIYNNILRTNLTYPAGSSQVNANLRVSGAVANLVFAFPVTNAKPYLIAGVGLYTTKRDTTNAKSQNNVGYNAGIGATFGFGPLAAFIESRYHSISRSAAKGGVFQFVPITLGVMF